MIVKTAEIKQKITADYILDLYEDSKKKKGKARRELEAQAKLLSQHIGSYIAKVKPIVYES